LTLEEIDWLFYEGKVVMRSRRVAKHGWHQEEGWSNFPRRAGHSSAMPVVEVESVDGRDKRDVVKKHEGIGK
jgi:hypothetical protein